MIKPITLTLSAAKHIQSEIIKASHETVGVKLSVKKTGCSGYAYVLDFVTATDIPDMPIESVAHVFNSHDINIYVDSKSYELVSGTEIDYVNKGIMSVMVFRNPNATAECGCGESFTVTEKK